MKTSIIKRIFTPIIITAIWLIIWQVIYIIVDNPLFVSSPIDVFFRIIELAQTKVFWQDVYLSVIRILIGFIFGIFLGLIMSFVCSVDFSNKFFAPIKLIIRATPVASFIMLA